MPEMTQADRDMIQAMTQSYRPARIRQGGSPMVRRQPLRSAVVIGEESGETALKRGKSGDRLPPDGGQQVAGPLERAPAGRALLLDDRDRGRCQKGVPPQASRVAGAVEQQEVWLAEEVLGGSDGGEIGSIVDQRQISHRLAGGRVLPLASWAVRYPTPAGLPVVCRA
jgi:hypothetical protein